MTSKKQGKSRAWQGNVQKAGQKQGMAGHGRAPCQKQGISAAMVVVSAAVDMASVSGCSAVHARSLWPPCVAASASALLFQPLRSVTRCQRAVALASCAVAMAPRVVACAAAWGSSSWWGMDCKVQRMGTSPFHSPG